MAIVLTTPMNDISTLMPAGKSVPGYIVPHTSELGVNFGRPCAVRSHAAGMMIMTTIKAIILNVEPALLTRAIHLVGNDAMQP